MPDPIPFSYRVILLLGLMLGVSVVDFCRNGARAARFREYGFILITGAVGAVVGCGNDWITSGISPDYFTLGKGLEEGPDLRIQAALFGLRVGFSAGVIGGAVCLYASRRKSAHPPVPFLRLFGMLWMPVAGAILCGIVLPLGFSGFDPARFSEKLDILVDSARVSRFLRVWWTHAGLYAGMVVGLTAMVVRAARGRKNPPAVNPSQ